jgi:hypothetical protein
MSLKFHKKLTFVDTNCYLYEIIESLSQKQIFQYNRELDQQKGLLFISLLSL